MRLTDFQVSVRPAGLSLEQQKAINEGMFPVYEALRLWLMEQKVVAPFKKLVVSLADSHLSEQWHGKPMVALGICEVTEAVAIEDLIRWRGVHHWTCRRVLDALDHVAAAIGWHCEDLVSFVRQVATQSPPCSHRFPGLSKHDKSGLACDVLLEADVGTTTVKVQFSGHKRPTTQVVVASRPGPLFIEDDFPMATTKIDNGQFVVFGKGKNVLAQVKIPDLTTS
jgi:hypothetical protein